MAKIILIFDKVTKYQIMMTLIDERALPGTAWANDCCKLMSHKYSYFYTKGQTLILNIVQCWVGSYAEQQNENRKLEVL